MRQVAHLEVIGCKNDAELQMIEVRAPISLPEGYTLVVKSENGAYQVTVPAGGVDEGQIFRVPYAESVCKREQKVRKGRWKDGLFNCFKLGFFHPSVCNAWCCPHLLMSQILSRMHMTWLLSPVQHQSDTRASHESSSSSMHSSFPLFGSKRTFALFATLFVFDFLFAPPLLSFDTTASAINKDTIEQTNNKDNTALLLKALSESIVWNELIYALISIPMTLYTFMVLVKLRAAVRAKYQIPSRSSRFCFFGFGGDQLEDYCCVFWCHCCTLAQLARQTANYEDQTASCCSRTGLPTNSTRTSCSSPTTPLLALHNDDDNEGTALNVATAPKLEVKKDNKQMQQYKQKDSVDIFKNSAK